MANHSQEVSAATEESTASLETVVERTFGLADLSNELNKIKHKFK